MAGLESQRGRGDGCQWIITLKFKLQIRIWIGMSELTITCPHCGQPVVVKNGRCPNCECEVKGVPVSEREALKKTIVAKALAARAKGASFGELETGLVNQGVGVELVKEIMLEVRGQPPEGVAARNHRELRHGLYWLVGGILVTVITYSSASSSPGGGTYVIASGPMIVGGYRFIKALINISQHR